MHAKKLVLDMVLTIPITFVVVAIATYLYSLIAHGTGSVNWETAFELSIVLGIVLPICRSRAG